MGRARGQFKQTVAGDVNEVYGLFGQGFGIGVSSALYNALQAAQGLTVGATDVNDVRAFFSNYGSSLDLFAPGVSITAAGHTADDATATFSGTSMAAPHVTGVAARYLSQLPDLTPAQVHAQLVSAAMPNVVVGAGTGPPTRVLYTALTHPTPPAAPRS